LLVPLTYLPLRTPIDLLADRSVNVALHLGVTLLAFAMARRLGTRELVAPATAVLFAVHPVHVAAIATSAGRTELLATLFSLAALLSFTFAGPWRVDGAIVSRPRMTEHLASMLAAACLLSALAASPVALSVLLLVLCLEWLFRPEGKSRRRAFAPSLIAVAAYLALRAAGISWRLADPSTAASEGGLPSALALLARQIGALFYPLNLSSHPGGSLPHPPPDLLSPLPLMGTAILAALVWVAALPLLKQRRAGFGARASFASLLFVLPYCVVAVLAIGQRLAFTERFLYFPSVGFCLLLSLAIGAISTGGPYGGQVRLAAFTLAALILGFSILTWARCLEWRDVLPSQDATSLTIRVGENGSSCAGGLPSTIQRES
jgi:hypothetical protein